MRNGNKIVVTGPTGNVGAEVIKLLAQQSQPVVAAAYNPDKARQQIGAGVSVVEFNFTKPDTFAATFDGASKLFLVRPPAIADAKRDIAPAIEAAKQAGVRHIVFLSIIGVERNPVVPHRAIEKIVRETGLAWTFLRASFFMQNLNTTHRDDIRLRDDIFIPAGNGKTSFVDVRDIAAVGAKALTEPGHENQAYPLTGSEALDYAQVAQIFTQVLGRRIRYSNPSPRRFGVEMRKRGMEVPFILVMNGLYTTCRLGLAARVTHDCERLLRRKPISMRQYVQHYRGEWS